MSHTPSRCLFVAVVLLTAACSGTLAVAPAASEDPNTLDPIAHERARQAAAALEGFSDEVAPSADEEAPAPVAALKPPSLRRLRGSELDAALVNEASRIIREHHREPFGTDVPFEIEGRRYVGRIEQHYHPEGGALRPWGFHKGCSLFAVEG